MENFAEDAESLTMIFRRPY